ncbi:MAG: DUF3093 domain-containing protein [Sporichthyaceae bacterium]
MTQTPAPLFSERLRVPAIWWLIPVFDLVVLAVGTHAYLGPVAAIVAGVGSVALVVWGLIAYGGLHLVVDADGFRAGRARLAPAALGQAWPLEPDQAKALRGPRADARARLVLRGYLPGAVRLNVADPAERVPYWYVSTRRPAELAAALNRVREGQSAW